MIQPDFKSFCKLARQGNLVPVYDTFTADTLTPVSAYLRLAHNARYACLLESVDAMFPFPYLEYVQPPPTIFSSPRRVVVPTVPPSLTTQTL